MLLLRPLLLMATVCREAQEGVDVKRHTSHHHHGGVLEVLCVCLQLGSGGGLMPILLIRL